MMMVCPPFRMCVTSQRAAGRLSVAASQYICAFQRRLLPQSTPMSASNYQVPRGRAGTGHGDSWWHSARSRRDGNGPDAGKRRGLSHYGSFAKSICPIRPQYQGSPSLFRSLADPVRGLFNVGINAVLGFSGASIAPTDDADQFPFACHFARQWPPTVSLAGV